MKIGFCLSLVITESAEFCLRKVRFERCDLKIEREIEREGEIRVRVVSYLIMQLKQKLK